MPRGKRLGCSWIIGLTVILASLLTVFAITPVAASASVPDVQVCTVHNSNSGNPVLCMNRKGQGTTTGTPVIGYAAGQSNNDFEWVELSGMCQHGHVSSNCPFANTNVDNQYLGKEIVEALWFNYADYGNTPICYGTDNSQGAGQLTVCPDTFGNGGGFGTILVLAQISDLVNHGEDTTYVVSRHWTDVQGTVSWLCSYSSGNAILSTWESGQAGWCQWHQVLP